MNGDAHHFLSLNSRIFWKLLKFFINKNFNNFYNLQSFLLIFFEDVLSLCYLLLSLLYKLLSSDDR